ncbi:site-specific integrase [Roseovarius sp. A46]|uniref:tyrosine-type recombinase/integrase n=1 Tax=Roseovarius sp. A46 TaxID=2109331 RepID=UPI0010109119|nr:site-specific integrase [Roseovarius sp. A46]RXV61222.1 site-specific integrase [Roseovarius sp. A46]
MASITKHTKGWRAQVARRGVRKSMVFPSKQEAKDWAAREEYQIINSGKIAAAMSLSSLFDRYAREVSPQKRGHRWEEIRLQRMAREIGHLRLGDMEARDVAAWRDARLRDVAPGSVRREMGLLSSVLRQAREEWGLMRDNPMKGVRKPAEPAPRDRLPSDHEIERMARVAGDDLSTLTARTFHAFRFACETAMRAGEIVGLTWDHLDLDTRVAHLAKTKNGYPRDVPMSKAAVALLRALPKRDPVFGLSSQQLDVLFRKIKDKAQVEGLTFHDSRAHALTKLSRKVDVLTLAKISGHRDLRILSNTYYRETAGDIAKRLDT